MGNTNLIYFNFIKNHRKKLLWCIIWICKGVSVVFQWPRFGNLLAQKTANPCNTLKFHGTFVTGGWKHGGFNIRQEPFPISQMHLRNSLNNWICHMHPQKSLKNHMPDRIQCYCRSYYTQFEELHTLSPQGSFHKNRSMADVRALF